MKTWQQQAAEIAAERIVAGEPADALVHVIWNPRRDSSKSYDELFSGLSSSITLEQFLRGGYANSYYELAEVASWA